MEKLTEFKIEDHLNSDEERVIFLRDCIESGDPAVVAAALGTIARSRNMAEL